MRCELSLALSWPSFQLPIATSYLETGSRLVHKMHLHYSVSNILRTTENCLRLSPTQFTPPIRQDSLVLSMSAVWTWQNVMWRSCRYIRRSKNWKSPGANWSDFFIERGTDLAMLSSVLVHVIVLFTWVFLVPLFATKQSNITGTHVGANSVYTDSCALW